MRYYGNPNQHHQKEFRYQLIKELGRLSHRNIITGFASYKILPVKFARFAKTIYDVELYLYN